MEPGPFLSPKGGREAWEAMFPHPLLIPPKVSRWDKPPMNRWPHTEAHIRRAGDESYHLKLLDRLFYHNAFVLNKQTLSELSQRPMEKEACHRFCWKDCAIYVTINLEKENELQVHMGIDSIFDYLYHTWFRGDEMHLAQGHFFAHPVCCWDSESPKTVDEIVPIHQLICDKIREKQADPRADDKEECVWGGKHENYRMKKSFDRFLVIVDKVRWWESDVVLVRSEKAKEMLGNDPDGKGEWPAFVQGDKGWAVRMELKEVVDLVRRMQDEYWPEDEYWRLEDHVSQDGQGLGQTVQ